MESRIEAETSETEAGDLWTATYILMGLRYPKALNAQLLQGVRRMKESVTYQAILEEGIEKGQESGALNEGRRMLLLAGARRLGTPSVEVTETVERIRSRERLEQLVQRVFDVETWEELLREETPSSPITPTNG
jgi:predicted transposase YdaD